MPASRHVRMRTHPAQILPGNSQNRTTLRVAMNRCRNLDHNCSRPSSRKTLSLKPTWVCFDLATWFWVPLFSVLLQLRCSALITWSEPLSYCARLGGSTGAACIVSLFRPAGNVRWKFAKFLYLPPTLHVFSFSCTGRALRFERFLTRRVKFNFRIICSGVHPRPPGFSVSSRWQRSGVGGWRSPLGVFPRRRTERASVGFGLNRILSHGCYFKREAL